MRSIYFKITLLLGTLTTTCAKETITQRNYPRVLTDEIQRLFPHGAEVRGQVIHLGPDPIIDHGFLWGVDEVTPIRVSLGPATDIGSFSVTLVGDMDIRYRYFVRAFAQTDQYLVQGNPHYFSPDVGPVPLAERLLPSSGVWGDTIRVLGQNFGDRLPRIEALFQPAYPTKVIRVSNNELTLEVPEISPGRHLIEITVSGQKTMVKEEFFMGWLSITSGFPNRGRSGDILTLEGSNFGVSTSRLKAFFETTPAEIIGVNRTLLRIRVPVGLDPTVPQRIYISGYGQRAMAPFSFTYIP